MCILDRKFSGDIEKAKGDERQKLEHLQSRERFKAMKGLDRDNERASPGLIARRQSKQPAAK